MSCIGWIAVGYLQRHKSHINFDLSLEKKTGPNHIWRISELCSSNSWKTFLKNPSQIRKWTIYKLNETNWALMQIFVTVNILRSVTFHRRCWLHAINFLFTLVMFCPVCRLFVPFSACVFFLSQTDGRPPWACFCWSFLPFERKLFFPFPLLPSVPCDTSGNLSKVYPTTLPLWVWISTRIPMCPWNSAVVGS